MTVKHTPGPWAIFVPKSLSNDDMVYGIDTNNGIKSESVVLFDGGILKKEDARLIAAAPDLLDALKGIIGYFDSGNSVSVSQATIKASSDEIKAARAAIAKATGGAAC